MQALRSIALLFLRASARPKALAVLALLVWVAAPGKAQSQAIRAGGNAELGSPTNSANALALGQLDARRDLSSGVMIVKTAGLPDPRQEDFAQLLKERCNVQLEPMAGCLVSSELRTYMEGYNEISGAAIKQKCGTNIFERLDAEAKARWYKRWEAENPPAKGAYLVKKGDTLTKIAHGHGVNLNALLQANPGINPARLQINQKVVIPERKQP